MRASILPRRFALSAAMVASLALLPAAAGALLGACGDDATSSKRVTLKTQITADDGVKEPFTNAYGWSIQLTKAAVSIGPLYYYDGAPIFSAGLAPSMRAPSRRARGARAALAWFFGVNTAHAHPGHYKPGNAMGQVLDPSSADLMKGVVELPTGDGVAGTYRSGSFTFGDPPAGDAVEQLDGHVVVLEGTATKDDMTRHFRAIADVGDVLDSYEEPKLEGCAFAEEPDVEADGTVTLHVKPSVWLDQSEFDDVPEGTPEAPSELTPDEEAFKAFVRGLKKGSAVIFSYEK